MFSLLSLARACPALRGPVAPGFGRGRALGVPTANLPSALFPRGALDDLARGVYVGWAATRGRVHKCVANVGVSPTFEARHDETVVEAHLLTDAEDDLYGDSLALLLVGYVRPERAFDSVDALRAAVRRDVALARSALDRAPYRDARHARWLREPRDEALAEVVRLRL